MANKHPLDQINVTNPTLQPFSVIWDRQTHTLQPGETRIWMRFLAEHFAKHLANAILLQREAAHKRAYLAKGGSERDYVPKSYLNNREMRPQVISTILLDVYQYYQETSQDANSIIQQQIDQLNPGAKQEKALELGEMADPLYGVMKGEDEPDDAPQLEAPNQQLEPAAAGASMIPDEPQTNAPLEAPAAPSTPASDGRSMKDLQAEAKKLGITVPFGANKDQVRELIRKQYA